MSANGRAQLKIRIRKGKTATFHDFTLISYKHNMYKYFLVFKTH